MAETPNLRTLKAERSRDGSDPDALKDAPRGGITVFGIITAMLVFLFINFVVFSLVKLTEDSSVEQSESEPAKQEVSANVGQENLAQGGTAKETAEVLDSAEETAETPVAEEEIAETPVAEEEVAETPVADVEVAEPPVADVEVAEPPVAEVEVAETPVADVKVAEAPVADVEVAEAPVAEVEVVETPVADVEVAETPVAAEEIAETPVADVEVAETPVADVEVAETPVADVEVAETPVAEEEVAETPVADVEIAETPVADVEVAETPVADVEVAETPVADVEVAETPVADVEVAETPVADVEVAEAPVTEEEVVETPVADVEVAEAPVTEEEVAETPVAAEEIAETPVADVEVAETPVAEEEVAETPVADVEVAETPVADVEVAETPVADVEVAEAPVAEVETAETPVADVEVAETPVADVEVAEAPVTAEETAEAPDTAEETAEAPFAAEETAEAPVTLEETAEAPVTAEETAEALDTLEETAEALVATEETAEAPIASEEVAETPDKTEEATDTLVTLREVARSLNTTEEIAEAPDTVEEAAETAEKTEEANENLVPLGEIAKNLNWAEEVAGAAATVEEVTEVPEKTEEIAEGPETIEEITEAPVTAEEVAEAPVTAEEVAEAPVTAEEVAEAPVTAEEVAEAPVTAEEVAEAPVTVEEVTEAPVTVEETAETPVPTEEVAVAPVKTEELAETADKAEETTDNPVSADLVASLVKTKRELADVYAQRKDFLKVIDIWASDLKTVAKDPELRAYFDNEIARAYALQHLKHDVLLSRAPLRAITAMAVGSQGKNLVASTRNGGVLAWDLDRLRIVNAQQPFTKAISHLVPSPHHDWMGVVSPREGVKLFSPSQSEVEKLDLTDKSFISGLVFFGQGQGIAVIHASGGLEACNLRGDCELFSNICAKNAFAVAASPADDQLLVGCDDGSIFMVNSASGSKKPIETKRKFPISSIDWIRPELAFVTDIETSFLLPLQGDDQKSGVKIVAPSDFSVITKAISPDQNILAVGNEAGLIQTFDLKTRAQLDVWRGHEQRISQLTFIDNKHLISSSWDWSAKLWRIGDIEPLASYEADDDGIGSFVFDPAHKRLFAASLSGELRWWSLAGALQSERKGGVKRVLRRLAPRDKDRFLLLDEENSLFSFDRITSETELVHEELEPFLSSWAHIPGTEIVVGTDLEGNLFRFDLKDPKETAIRIVEGGPQIDTLVPLTGEDFLGFSSTAGVTRYVMQPPTDSEPEIRYEAISVTERPLQFLARDQAHGKILVVDSEESTLWTFDAKTLENIQRFIPSQKPLTAWVGEDGRVLVAALKEKSIEIISVLDGKFVARLHDDGKRIIHSFYAPETGYFHVISERGRISSYRLDRENPVWQVELYTSITKEAQLAANGRRLLLLTTEGELLDLNLPSLDFAEEKADVAALLAPR